MAGQRRELSSLRSMQGEKKRSKEQTSGVGTTKEKRGGGSEPMEIDGHRGRQGKEQITMDLIPDRVHSLPKEGGAVIGDLGGRGEDFGGFFTKDGSRE